MIDFLRSVTQRFFSWLGAQIHWRNTVRLCGLGGMMWLTLTQPHPDPEALIALGAMIGLPSFLALVPVRPEGDIPQPKPRPPKEPDA